MTEESSGDSRPSPGGYQLYKTLSALIGSTVRWLWNPFWRDYKEFKQITRRRLNILQKYLYHLTATSFVMVFLIAVPTLIAIGGAWINSKSIGGGGVDFISIHAMFFGFAGMAAVGYVYAARFGFWVRRMMINYWRKRTLPFPIEADDSEKPIPACDADKVPNEDWTQAKAHCWDHLWYALLVHGFGFWGVIFLLALVPDLESGTVLNVIHIITQALAVLLGGIPALVGLVLASPQIPLLGSVEETSLLVVVTASLLPALLIAIAVRNIAYWSEVKFHNLWMDGPTWAKLLVVGYLLWVVITAIKQISPSVLPV